MDSKMCYEETREIKLDKNHSNMNKEVYHFIATNPDTINKKQKTLAFPAGGEGVTRPHILR